MKRIFVFLFCSLLIAGLLLACTTIQSSKTKPGGTYQQETKPKVEVLSHSATVSYGRYRIAGEVQNNGQVKADWVRVNATFYDANKKVVDTGFTYTEPKTLEPGQKAPFEVMNFKEEVTGAIASYELQVVVQ